MNIAHIAMFVLDLEATKAFFIKYFGAEANELYHNTRTNFQSYFLSFGNGAELEIMTRPDLTDKDKGQTLTGYHHIAISVGDKEKVDSLTEQLSNDGYTIVSGPRTTGDGFYESCVLGPENNMIEITI